MFLLLLLLLLLSPQTNNTMSLKMMSGKTKKMGTMTTTTTTRKSRIRMAKPVRRVRGGMEKMSEREEGTGRGRRMGLMGDGVGIFFL